MAEFTPKCFTGDCSFFIENDLMEKAKKVCHETREAIISVGGEVYLEENTCPLEVRSSIEDSTDEQTSQLRSRLGMAPTGETNYA